MAEIRETYHNFAKAFVDSILAFSIYPEKHPIVESALANLIGILEDIFKENDRDIEIVVKGRNLLVNDVVLDVSKGFVIDLLNYLVRLELSNFSVQRTCTKDDVVDLVSFFAENAKRKGNVEKMVDSFTPSSYSQASSAAKPTLESEAKAAPSKKPKILALEVLEKLFRSGPEALKEFIAFDAAEVLEFIRRNPEKTVDIMMEAVKHTGSINLVWQRLGDWLIKAVREVGFKLENVRFSNLVYALGKILTSRLRLIYTEEEASENLSALYAEIYKYTGKLKVMEIVSKISEKEADMSHLASVVIEAFDSQEEKERLLPLIKDELKNRAWQTSKIEEVTGYISNIFIPIKPKAESEFDAVLQAQFLGQGKTSGSSQASDASQHEALLLNDAKKAYAQLEKKQKRLDKIIRKLGLGVLVVDKDNKIILANKDAEQILGRKLDDIKAKPLDKVLDKGHVLMFVQRSESRFLEENIVVVGERLVAESIASSWAIVEDENGDAIGVLGILSEENKIRELEKIKNDLIANVYERLIKPLTASLDMVRVLLEEVNGSLNEEQKRILEDTQGNLEYIKGDLSKMLTLNRLRNATELNIENFDFVSLLKEIHAFFQVIFSKKQVNLELKISTKNKYVEADREKTKEILKEILTNAFKASRENSTVVIFYEDSFNDEGSPMPFVKVRVRDQGVGIKREDLARVSDMFFAKGEKSLRGLGLGLSLVKEIVEKQGGRLTIDSSVGRGSEVSFTLPKSK